MVVRFIILKINMEKNMLYTKQTASEVHKIFQSIQDKNEKIEFIKDLKCNHWFTTVRKNKLINAWEQK
jgi:hypothetical protein